MATALAQCIFFVGMGSNDYLNNYLMPNYPTRNQYNGQQYANLLVQTYNEQLRVTFLSSSDLSEMQPIQSLVFLSIILYHKMCNFCVLLSKKPSLEGL